MRGFGFIALVWAAIAVVVFWRSQILVDVINFLAALVRSGA